MMCGTGPIICVVGSVWPLMCRKRELSGAAPVGIVIDGPPSSQAAPSSLTGFGVCSFFGIG